MALQLKLIKEFNCCFNCIEITKCIAGYLDLYKGDETFYSPQTGSTENWNFVLVLQVTVWSPLSSYPSLQLRDRTVPAETGNCLSVCMLVQVAFRPVQSEQ